MSEQTIFVRIIGLKEDHQEAKLYAHFKSDFQVYMTLVTSSLFLESHEYSFMECLISILEKLPEGCKLKLQNKVHVMQDKQLEILQIEEFVSLAKVQSSEDNQIHFLLQCNYNGVSFEADGIEDFSIALTRLQKKMDVKFFTCFFCENAEFKSVGGEDLRHGWYCLREIRDKKLGLPWHERVDEFEKAIPNVSAFHWCPKFNWDEDKLF